MSDSEYPVNYLKEKITTYGAAKKNMETLIGFLLDYKSSFPEEPFEETIMHLRKALGTWSELRLPTKERWG